MAEAEAQGRPFPLEKITGRIVPPGGAMFIGNVGSEHLWEPPGALKFPYVANERVRRVINRCDELQLYVAAPQDTVVLRRPLDPAFAQYLEAAGLRLPRVEAPEAVDDALTLGELALRDEALLSRLRDGAARARGGRAWLVPFAGTAAEAEIAGRLGAELAAGDPQTCAAFNNKAEARRLAQSLGLAVTEGQVCHGVEELGPAYQKLCGRFAAAALKELYGVSGRGLVVVDSPARFEAMRRTLARRAATGGSMLVEGWYEASHSLNCQFLAGDGAAHPHFCGQQLLVGGMFTGSLFPAAAGVGQEEAARHMEAARLAALEVARAGYRGVVGVDTLVTRQGEFFPVIEINARFNFSTYFFAARRLLGDPPAAVGRWLELRLGRPLALEELLGVLGDGAPDPRGSGWMLLTFGSVNANAGDGAPGPALGRAFVLCAGDDAPQAAARAARLAGRVERYNAGELGPQGGGDHGR